MFIFGNKVAAVTGGGGELCSMMSAALAKTGCSVAVLDIEMERAAAVSDKIVQDGGKATAHVCDVTNRQSVENCLAEILTVHNKVDILINGAGGNHPRATTSANLSFFDLDLEAFQKVFGLNIIGTVLPSQVFGKEMARQKQGTILNIASMNAFRPLTRIPAYSAAKAAVANFTQWLAVHMAQEYSANIRVNAIAPGFFLGNQNRFLLIDQQTGEMTPRGKAIIQHTPMGRYGETKDLFGTMFWLLSDASAFVTGIVVPIDGGFSAFSGV